MKVYFACSSTELKKNISHYLAIVNFILSLNFEIPHNWLLKVSKKMKDPNYDPEQHILKKSEIQKEGIKSIKESDLLIADLSIPSTSVGYQVFMAIERGLPVLCLYSLDFGIKKPPQIIESFDSSLLNVSPYIGDGYKRIIRDFLKKIKGKKLIKFNFIATREIIDYLNWLSKKLKITKSAALRGEIEEKLIKLNEEYKNLSKIAADR